MIVTFGSINVDFVFELADMPQPGQTLLADGLRVEAGGKGANQALAAARDGAQVTMVGAVGRDALAATALQNLAGAVDVSRVARLDGPTGCASIYIDADGRNMIAVAAGANLKVPSAAVNDALLEQASVVLMQMENDPQEIAALIGRVAASSALSILNLAPAFRLETNLLSACNIIIVNEDEADVLGEWLGCSPSARALSEALGTGVLRTLGGQGAEAFVNQEHVHVAARKVEVKDTTAAGDCFVGVLASALDRGFRLKEAMERASVAAALACTRHGSQNSIPTSDETEAFFASASL
ncbi:ribokinase [Pseudorhizobium flavum]|uniref:ribokinase n=1 Tax=Pseudorhizobium flavum TaxID=1335061 RepID=UPI002491C37F|nr:ribokinase [Pseudorhizobium flavum]